MSQPIRMCIACRERAPQHDLHRVQLIDGALMPYAKTGRSFYICATCKRDNVKKLLKALNHKCKTNHKTLIEFGQIFKETGSNG